MSAHVCRVRQKIWLCRQEGTFSAHPTVPGTCRPTSHSSPFSHSIVQESLPPRKPHVVTYSCRVPSPGTVEQRFIIHVRRAATTLLRGHHQPLPDGSLLKPDLSASLRASHPTPENMTCVRASTIKPSYPQQLMTQ